MYERLRAVEMTLKLNLSIPKYECFPGSMVVNDKPANAGDTRDTGLILWSGRSPGEGVGYPLQYSWASLVAQTVKFTFIKRLFSCSHFLP